MKRYIAFLWVSTLSLGGWNDVMCSPDGKTLSWDDSTTAMLEAGARAGQIGIGTIICEVVDITTGQFVAGHRFQF